jgi:hypothetical protein
MRPRLFPTSTSYTLTRRLLAGLTLAFVFLTGSEDSKGATVYGRLALPTQCEGFSRGGADSSPEITSMLKLYVPADLPVHWTIKRKYTARNRQISLACVGYGQLHDCLAGCFYSTTCATYDGGTSLLYSAVWYGEKERPVGIETVCPGVAQSLSGSTMDCPGPLPGETHLLVESRQYGEFRQKYGRARAGLCPK